MLRPVETWISRRPLHEEVAERLRGMIARNTVGPGARLNERALTEQLGVSRTPLREAFKTLAAEGLIELLPNRGAVVATLNRDRMQQTLEVLGALEALAGELACANATSDEIATLRQHHDQMQQHFDKREAEPFLKHYHTLHLAIVRATGNDVLTDIYRTLTAQIKRVRTSAIDNESAWVRVMDEHVQIIDALESRAAGQLSGLLESHTFNSASKIIAAAPKASSTSRAWANDD